MKEVTLNSYSAFTIPFAGVHPLSGLLIRSDGYVMPTSKKKASCIWKKGTIDKNGYYRVIHNRKTVYVHRLVAETFLKNNKNLPVVDHIDRDRQNSSVFNLRFCSYSENICNSNRVDRARAKPKRLRSDYYNKDRAAHWWKQYYLEHKEDIKARHRKYYQEHKDSIAARQKEYHKKYYADNREKISLYAKEHYNKHKANLSKSAPIPGIEQYKSDSDHND